MCPFETGPLTRAGSLDHHDPKLESLREDPLPVTLQLPRTNLDRDDRREQPNQ
jgi:hypothetical protein